MFATDSKPPQNEVLKVWYLITLLKLSGPDGTRAHIKAIKIIMEKFQRRSQRCSRYTVHTVHSCSKHILENTQAIRNYDGGLSGRVVTVFIQTPVVSRVLNS